MKLFSGRTGGDKSPRKSDSNNNKARDRNFDTFGELLAGKLPVRNIFVVRLFTLGHKEYISITGNCPADLPIVLMLALNSRLAAQRGSDRFCVEQVPFCFLFSSFLFLTYFYTFTCT